MKQQQNTKPGSQILVNMTDVTIKHPVHNYVSRGALKLIGALDHFAISPADLVCLDIDSSTGGFTEVLLYITHSIKTCQR